MPEMNSELSASFNSVFSMDDMDSSFDNLYDEELEATLEDRVSSGYQTSKVGFGLPYEETQDVLIPIERELLPIVIDHVYNFKRDTPVPAKLKPLVDALYTFRMYISCGECFVLERKDNVGDSDQDVGALEIIVHGKEWIRDINGNPTYLYQSKAFNDILKAAQTYNPQFFRCDSI